MNGAENCPAVPAGPFTPGDAGPFTPGDGDGLFAILGDRETMRDSFPMTRGEGDDFLENSLLRREPPVGYALEERGSRGLAGYILFCPLKELGAYGLGWFLRRDLWGRGYAYDISQALLDYAFAALGLRRVEGETIILSGRAGCWSSWAWSGWGKTGQQICRGHPAALYQYTITAEQWREQVDGRLDG